MFGAKDKGAVGGKEESDMRVGVAGAAQAMGEEDCGVGAWEEGGVLRGGDGGVVEVAREEAVSSVLRSPGGVGRNRRGSYERKPARKEFAPANLVYPAICSLCGAGSHVALFPFLASPGAAG